MTGANGSVTNGGTIVFDGGSASSVDIANGELYLPQHGLTTGQEITYTAQKTIPGSPDTPFDADAIGGLTSGSTYYVLVVDADHIQFSNKPPIALDPTVTDPAATQTLTELRWRWILKPARSTTPAVTKFISPVMGSPTGIRSLTTS